MATISGANAVFLFVAELNGYKSGPSMDDKIQYGIRCWLSTKLLELDLEQEDHRKHLHENIWLERLYLDLDRAFGLDNIEGAIRKELFRINPCDMSLTLDPNYSWTVPIELDAGASMLQVEAMLLGDLQLATATNMVEGLLTDPWSIKGLTRNQVKKACTPMLYGSSQACYELWESNGIQFGIDEVRTYNEALNTGYLAVANLFKEFIINNCKPSPIMDVTIWGESFRIECNRFRNVGERTVGYDIYDSESDTIKRVFHTTTAKVPDLDQFRRYFVTLLVHNIDSQVADAIAEAVYDEFGWVIDIHDAFIVNPEAASFVRAKYAELMEEIFTNRKAILGDYFRSIGISSSAQKQWNQLQSKIVPMDSFKCGPMALK